MCGQRQFPGRELECEWDKVEKGVHVSVKMTISDLIVPEMLGVSLASRSEETVCAAVLFVHSYFLRLLI